MPTPEQPARSPLAIREALSLLHTLMDGRTLTAPEAARRHRFQEPAVRRHLQTIQQIFHEVVTVPVGRAIGYRYVWPREQASDAATVLALELARAALGSVRGSHLDNRLANLTEQHLRRTPESETLGADLARMLVARSRMHEAAGADADAVDRIAQGITSLHQITFDYEHFGGKRARVAIEPWSLVPSEEGLYCLGRCTQSDRPEHIDTRRLYKVARMGRVRKSAERFLYPTIDTYDPREVFRHCFGVFLPPEGEEPVDVTLAFAPHWHAWLQHERVHPTQQGPQRRADGWLQVRLRVYPTLDLQRWLRGLGGDVRVEAPEELRRQVQQ